MAWLAGICLGAWLIGKAILVFMRGRREDQPENYFADDPEDGTELDLSAVSPFGSCLNPTGPDQPITAPLHAVLQDLHRRAAERKADVQQSAKANGRGFHRPIWR